MVVAAPGLDVVEEVVSPQITINAKLTCDAETLNNAIAKPLSIIPNKPSNPVYGYFLLRVARNEASLESFNGSIAVAYKFEVSSKDSFEVCLPAKLLSEIVSKLTGKLTLAFDENGCKLKSSSSGQYRIPVISSEQFPEVDRLKDPKSLTLPGDILCGMFELGMFASKDEARGIIAGVCFQLSDGKAKAIATDGKRCALHEQLLACDDGALESFVVSAKEVLSVLKKLIDQQDEAVLDLDVNLLRLSIEKTRIQKGQKKTELELPETKTEQLTIVCRLLNGRYPEVESIIPQSFSEVIECSRKELIDVLERCAILASDTQHVFLELKGEVLDCSIKTPNGDILERVDISTKAKKFQQFINVSHWLEALNSLSSEKVILQTIESGVSKPTIIEPIGCNRFLHLVMSIVKAENPPVPVESEVVPVQEEEVQEGGDAPF